MFPLCNFILNAIKDHEHCEKVSDFRGSDSSDFMSLETLKFKRQWQERFQKSCTNIGKKFFRRISTIGSETLSLTLVMVSGVIFDPAALKCVIFF